MARKNTLSFTCQNCGAKTARWEGKCSSCDGWNTIVEDQSDSAGIGAGPLRAMSKGRIVPMESLDGDVDTTPRTTTGNQELDRVTGGGLVPGSAILVGGEPGIGKSTLLLQIAANLANAKRKAVYFSGEEATLQVRLRADRLGLKTAPVALAAETSLANILATLNSEDAPDLLIIDSIQTLWSSELDSAPGTVSQVRACVQKLIQFAKKSHTTLILVGHVTKEGQIAGPKVVEHMVDTVLYFEGDKGHQFRILRAVKNRFGPTDEIGVYEMRNQGLVEVENPSALFLGERDGKNPGTSVFAGIEGTRPLLVEIQALVAPSSLGTPRRAVLGWDSNRLSMLLAVLETRCGVPFSGCDVYLNVAGGLKISEPAADLAAAAALVSARSAIPLPADRVYFGEVSLSGAIRSVGHMQYRLKEADKLGFKSATLPDHTDIKQSVDGIELHPVSHLSRLTIDFTKDSQTLEKMSAVS